MFSVHADASREASFTGLNYCVQCQQSLKKKQLDKTNLKGVVQAMIAKDSHACSILHRGDCCTLMLNYELYCSA